MQIAAFTVRGIPAPKGSMKAFHRPGMKFAAVTHDNARTKPWSALVSVAAAEAMRGAPPEDCPMVVILRFWLPKPKSAPKRVTLPAKKPDVDKLTRCVLDAMKGIIYTDDARIVGITVSKEFGPPGVSIDVRGVLT